MANRPIWGPDEETDPTVTPNSPSYCWQLGQSQITVRHPASPPAHSVVFGSAGSNSSSAACSCGPPPATHTLFPTHPSLLSFSHLSHLAHRTARGELERWLQPRSGCPRRMQLSEAMLLAVRPLAQRNGQPAAHHRGDGCVHGH
jgi:hypothetical protein